MRGIPTVSDERRTRVLVAAAELGYRPNAMARGLASRRSNIVGVLLNDLHNPFFAEIYDGISVGAERRGYRLLLGSAGRRPKAEHAAIEAFLEYRPDGVVLVSPRLPSASIVELSRSVPVTVVGRIVRADAVDCVMTDEAHGGRLAVEHLVALGHRDIVHIDGGAGAGARQRRAGYLKAMATVGLADHRRVIGGEFTEQAGARAALRLLRSETLPTAVFAANDLAASGALDALEGAGLAVPDDVSVIGYDNSFVARLQHVSLSTIDQPREEMGRIAISLLLERIGDPRRDSTVCFTTPTLVARRSTGRARA
jgi:DNA-binding LacI/PurR family transcriptional regulator